MPLQTAHFLLCLNLKAQIFPINLLCEAPLKEFNCLLKSFQHSIFSYLQKINVSSAIWRQWTWILIFPTLEPSNFPFSYSLFNKALNILLINKKMKGESGSPWILLVALILPLGLPLMNIEYFGLEIQPMIHVIHLVSTFFSMRIFSRNSQSTLSKSCSKSNFRIHPFFFLARYSSTASFAIRIGFKICLPSMKVLCGGDYTRHDSFEVFG